MVNELVVLGSSGSAPSTAGPASGYLVRIGGATVVLDLGPGTFGRLLAEVPIHGVDAVVVSHGHADHAADLVAWYHAARYGLTPRAAVPLLAPVDVLDRVGSFLRKGPDEVGLVFDRRPVDVPGSVVGAAVSFAEARHGVPAISVRLESEGRSLVYSGDTAPNPGLLDLAGGADVLLCEATAAVGPVDGHMGADEAGELARRAGVGRLVLTHLREGVEPAGAVAAAGSAFDGPVSLAEPGLRLPI